MTPTTQRNMIWAAELVLAVDGHDEGTVNRILHEASETPDGASALVSTLCGTVASLLADMNGPRWREGMAVFLTETKGG